MNDIIRTLLRLKIPGQFLRFSKWIVITIIGLFLILVIWFVSYIAIDEYNDSFETMITFECLWDKFEQMRTKILRARARGVSEKVVSEYLEKNGWTPKTYELVIKNKSKGEKINSETFPRWYLVQKKRKEDLPYGLYRGSHKKAVIGDEKIYMQNRLTDYDSKYYYFGISDPPKKDEVGHKINRKTLKTSYYKDGIPETVQCKEISESEFYRNVEREIKIKKESVKF